MRCRRGPFLRGPGGLPLLLLAGLLCLPACNRRRPLPRSADAGPAVELVERRATPAQVDPALLPPGGFADEREPNDDRDHAQPIDAGKGLRGSVLPPAQGASGKGDDDFYSYLVQAPPTSGGAPDATAARELTVVLTGGPTADLALEVLDGEGRRLLSLDERKKGEPESLAGLVLPLGQTLYLRVRPSPRMAGRAEWPGADANYQLLVNERPAPQGSEIEPNDTPEQATAVPGAPVGQGVDLSGRVLGKKDEDWFALGPAGAGEADGGQRGPGLGPGHAQGDILRVELTTPGVTPALRLLLPGAPGSRERRQLLEVRAPQGSEELMLRNVALPEGAQGVLLHLRALSLRRLEAGSAEARYQLRVTREPKLEGAEVEPNDACAQATLLPQGGDAVAGFLWPGDVDCFRLPVQAPLVATFHLNLPPGECQAELLPAEGAPGTPGTAGQGGGKAGTGKGERLPAELTIQSGSDVLVRVVQRGARACFAAPYRLSATTQPVPAP
jgi:hypothetical protein